MRQHQKLPAHITTAAAAALIATPLEHVEVKAARPPGVRVRVAQQSHGAYLMTIISQHGAGDSEISARRARTCGCERACVELQW